MSKYKQISEQIENLDIAPSKKISCMLLSILMAFLIVIGPIAVCINLLLFSTFTYIIMFLLASLIILFAFLRRVFYYKGITEGKMKGIYTVILTDMFVFSFAIYTILLIIVMMGAF